MLDNVYLGKRIRKYREQAKLTQIEVASLLDSNENYISRIETGNATPSLRMIFNLANIFSVDAGCLISQSVDAGCLISQTDDESLFYYNDDLFEMISKLSPYKKKLLISTITLLEEYDIKVKNKNDL